MLLLIGGLHTAVETPNLGGGGRMTVFPLDENPPPTAAGYVAPGAAGAAVKRSSLCPSVALREVLPALPFSPPIKRASSAFSHFAVGDDHDGGAPTAHLRLISWICSMAGFLFGYSSSSINDSIPFIIREMGLSPAAVGLVSACFLVGAGIGGIVGGKLADRFGRKRALVFFDAVHIVGTLCTSLAPTFGLLVPARMLLGFSSGGITSTAPVLCAEIATAEYRSHSVTLSLLFVVFGEMCVFIVGAALGNIWYDVPTIWRWMNAGVLVPAVGLLLCHALFVPESPRWLAQMGHQQRAYETLRKLRRTSLQTQNELREIENVISGCDAMSDEESTDPIPSLSTILTVPWIRSVILIGIGVSMTQQAYGVVIGMMFGTHVLEEAGLGTKLALIGNIAVGVVSFLASWGGLLLVTRMCRRSMLMAGQIGAICMHILIAICSALLPYGPLRGWITLGLLLPFLVFAQGSISTVTWLLTAEIFPLNLRGIGAGFGMLVAWASACAVAQLFPVGVHYVGQAVTFACLAAIGLILLAFVWLFLPETRDKTLEELERQFRKQNWKALKRPGEGNARGEGLTRRRQNGRSNDDKY